MSFSIFSKLGIFAVRGKTRLLKFGVLFSPQTPPPEPDQSALWRKCHSQFTDVDDYRRHGLNTWHDETGVYANSMVRDQVLKPTNPIPDRLAWIIVNLYRTMLIKLHFSKVEYQNFPCYMSRVPFLDAYGECPSTIDYIHRWLLCEALILTFLPRSSNVYLVVTILI